MFEGPANPAQRRTAAAIAMVALVWLCYAGAKDEIRRTRLHTETSDVFQSDDLKRLVYSQHQKLSYLAIL
jgi:hypothetical protein